MQNIIRSRASYLWSIMSPSLLHKISMRLGSTYWSLWLATSDCPLVIQTKMEEPQTGVILSGLISVANGWICHHICMHLRFLQNSRKLFIITHKNRWFTQVEMVTKGCRNSALLSLLPTTRRQTTTTKQAHGTLNICCAWSVTST